MSELILTEEEEAMAIMDTPDKPLADAVRHCYAVMHHIAEKLDKPIMAVAAQHACVFVAKETNADRFESNLEGLTCRDDDLGNWRILIERLDESMSVSEESKRRKQAVEACEGIADPVAAIEAAKAALVSAIRKFRGVPHARDCVDECVQALKKLNWEVSDAGGEG